MKNHRPKIPETVKLGLWACSGGRCEFPGCNKLVWRDGLTLQNDNFANIAHLVAASPNGPRGDTELSPKLAKDFSNLMLLCLNHAKLIDGRQKSNYSLEFLRHYKAEHEKRIMIQTAIGPDKATTVVRFIANIRERRMEIPTSQAYEAILHVPRFPVDERGIELDFSNTKAGSGSKSFWKSFADDIARRVNLELSLGNNHRRIEHLSIFAIAPIPLLIYFGNRIGGSIPADIYQKHRDTDDWNWKPEQKGKSSLGYIVKRRGVDKESSRVALILSLSGHIHHNEVEKVLPAAPHYEVTISNPNRDFFQYQSQIKAFSHLYHNLLAEIRKRHGGKCEVCLFPAAPVAIAVECGRALLPKADPHVHVYDYDNERGGFIPTLTIN